MIQSALILKLKDIIPRVFANVAPAKSPLPVITVDLDGSFRNRHWSNGRIATGLIETDFEITCWSTKTTTAYDTGAQVVSLLENFSGPMLGGSSPQEQYRVEGIEITGEQSDHDASTQLWAYSVFITITHTEG